MTDSRQAVIVMVALVGLLGWAVFHEFERAQEQEANQSPNNRGVTVSVQPSPTPYIPPDGIARHSQDAAITAIQQLYAPSKDLMAKTPDFQNGLWIAKIGSNPDVCQHEVDCWEVSYDLTFHYSPGLSTIRAKWVIDLETMRHLPASEDARQMFIDSPQSKTLYALARDRERAKLLKLGDALASANSCTDEATVEGLGSGFGRDQLISFAMNRCAGDLMQVNMSTGMNQMDAFYMAQRAVSIEVDAILSHRGQ